MLPKAPFTQTYIFTCFAPANMKNAIDKLNEHLSSTLHYVPVLWSGYMCLNMFQQMTPLEKLPSAAAYKTGSLMRPTKVATNVEECFKCLIASLTVHFAIFPEQLIDIFRIIFRISFPYSITLIVSTVNYILLWY